METGKKNYKANYLKFSLALILCLIVRLIPFRAPNVEPILGAMMPVSRAYGAFLGFSFAVLSILLYDIISGTLGVQTFFTTFAYGALGLWAASYFKKDKLVRKEDGENKWSYVRFAVIGTLFFDAVTGLTVGPLFYDQPFISSLLGQIPFTLLHLLGNTALAFVLSPAIYNYLVRKKKPRPIPFISLLNNPKAI